MNNSTKGTNMIEREWHVEGDWSKADRGSEVCLRNGDGAEVTIVIYDRQDPRVKGFDAWITSKAGFTYREHDWTLFVKLPPKIDLPQVAGVYQDSHGRHFFISKKDGHGLFGDEMWVNDASELRPPFVLLESVTVTATQVVRLLMNSGKLKRDDEMRRALRFRFGVEL